MTIATGAFFEPNKTRKRKTNAAVGALFKAKIVGRKIVSRKGSVPARIPMISAEAKAIENPIKVRPKEENTLR